MHTQYIVNSNGEKIAVVLPIKAYEKLLDKLEELHDIQLYDEAKREDDGERIPMEEVFKRIEEKRKKQP